MNAVDNILTNPSRWTWLESDKANIEAWVMSARKGDESASRALLHRYTYLMAKMCRRYGSHLLDEDQDECLAEAKLALFEAVQKFDPKRAKFTFLLCLIVRRRVIDFIRSGYKQAGTEVCIADLNEVYEPQDPAPDPGAKLAQDELYADLAAAKASLTPKERRVVELVHEQGKPVVAVRQILKCTTLRVQLLLAGAEDKIRKYLENR